MTSDKKYLQAVAILMGMLNIGASATFAGQPLETETARLPKQGHGNAQAVYEYQWSGAGRESAVPLAFEYGILNRLEIAVEPVIHTSIRPKTGPSATGFGDTEVTLTYLLANETRRYPAFAIASEIKFPTTHDPLIGTGGTDFRIVGIASKRLGPLDLHANLGYTVVGTGSIGAYGNNFDVIDYAVAAEYDLAPMVALVTEVLGTVSAGGGESTPGAAQEAAGTTLTGLLGGAYRPGSRLECALGFTYDDAHATLARAAFTFKF